MERSPPYSSRKGIEYSSYSYMLEIDEENLTIGQTIRLFTLSGFLFLSFFLSNTTLDFLAEGNKVHRVGHL